MELLKISVFALLVPVVLCGSCPNYWASFDGHCYRLYKKEVMWSTARSRCQDNSAYLVSINSASENSFVAYLSACMSETVQGPCTWIGMGPNYHHMSPKRWQDGSTLTYHHWASGEPNNNGSNEGCIETNLGGRGKWNDKACSGRFQYICEKAAR